MTAARRAREERLQEQPALKTVQESLFIGRVRTWRGPPVPPQKSSSTSCHWTHSTLDHYNCSYTFGQMLCFNRQKMTTY